MRFIKTPAQAAHLVGILPQELLQIGAEKGRQTHASSLPWKARRMQPARATLGRFPGSIRGARPGAPPARGAYFLPLAGPWA